MSLRAGTKPAGSLFGLGFGAPIRIDLVHRLSALATLFPLIIVFALMNGAFLSINNAMTILLQTAVIGLLGIGLTIVIKQRRRLIKAPGMIS